VVKDAVIGDDLKLLSDAAVLSLGADSDVTLTHVADTGVLLNSTRQLQFRDSALGINSSTDGQLDIDADVEVEITTTTVDLNGALDVSGTSTLAGAVASGAITSSGIIKTDDATEATSTTDGSLQTDGGLSVVKDAVIGDDLKLLSDAAVLSLGADSDVTLTHVADAGVLLNSTSQLQFRDNALKINSSTDGQLDIDADTEVEITTTTVDLNGALDVSGTSTLAGAVASGAITSSGIIKTDDATEAKPLLCHRYPIEPDDSEECSYQFQTSPPLSQ